MAFTCVGFAAGAQNADDRQKIEQRVGADLAGLLSEDAQVRCNSYQNWLRRRVTQIQFLEHLAGTEKEQYDNVCDSRELAIRMLGHAGKCSPVLVRNLDWRYPGQISRSGYLAKYPCAEAVANCGVRSIPFLLTHLAGDSAEGLTEKRIVLGALVVLIANGRGNKDAAIKMVEEIAADAPLDEKLELWKVLDAVQNGLEANLKQLAELRDKER